MADLTKSRMHIDHVGEDAMVSENPEETLGRLGAAKEADVVSESLPEGKGRLRGKKYAKGRG